MNVQQNYFEINLFCCNLENNNHSLLKNWLSSRSYLDIILW